MALKKAFRLQQLMQLGLQALMPVTIILEEQGSSFGASLKLQ